VLFPAQRPTWLDAWIEEHVAFPAGRHDDQVDTTSLALERLRASDPPGEANVGGDGSLLRDLGAEGWRGTGALDEGISAGMAF
jgi:hypothetical protein